MRPAALLLLALAGCEGPMVAPLRYGAPTLTPEDPSRSAAPDSAPVLAAPALAFHEMALPNGLRIAHLPRRGLPVIAARLVVERGGADAAAPVATFELLRRAMSSATRPRNQRPLAEAWADLGATHGVAFGPDDCTLGAHAGAADLDAALALLAESALRPHLDAGVVDELRRAYKRDLAAAHPEIAVRTNESAALFGHAHAYGFARPLSMHVDAPRAADLVALHARLFQPAQATLIVVGDASAEAVLAAATRAFGAWAASGPPMSRAEETPPEPGGPRVIHVVRPEAAPIQVWVTARGPAADDADFPALEILGAALSRMGPRFLGEAPEERGTARLQGSVQRGRLASVFHVGGTVRAEHYFPALRALVQALRDLNREIVTDDIDRARAALVSAFRNRASSVDGLAALAAAQLSVGRPLAELTTYSERLRAVTYTDVRRAARNHLHPDALRLVVFAPQSARAELEKLGLGLVETRDDWADPVALAATPRRSR